MTATFLRFSSSSVADFGPAVDRWPAWWPAACRAAVRELEVGGTDREAYRAMLDSSARAAEHEVAFAVATIVAGSDWGARRARARARARATAARGSQLALLE